MFYDNKVCDGCSEPMLEGEDIVVCPECGTPQHRECYKKNNECVNAHLHAEGFDWRTANPESEENKPEVKEEPQEDADVKERPADFTSAEDIPDIPIPEIRLDGIYVKGQVYGGEEDIGGATVKEIATYTQVNPTHYLRKFIRNRDKKSFFLSWNWGAFFFGPAWFFYRKLYKVGAILLALAISATIAVIPLAADLPEEVEKIESMYAEFLTASKNLAMEESEENMTAYENSLNTVWTALKAVLPESMIVLLSDCIIANIIPALLANYFYRRKMFEDIRFAKRSTSDTKVLRYSLIRRGGVSFLAGFLAMIASSHLPNIIMSIVSYFTN